MSADAVVFIPGIKGTTLVETNRVSAMVTPNSSTGLPVWKALV